MISSRRIPRDTWATIAQIIEALEQIKANRDFPLAYESGGDRPSALRIRVSAYLGDPMVTHYNLRTALRKGMRSRPDWREWHDLVFSRPDGPHSHELDPSGAEDVLLEDPIQPEEDVSSHSTEAEETSHFAEVEEDFHFAEAEETYYFAEAEKRPHLMRAERTPFFAEVQEIYRLAGMEEPNATAGEPEEHTSSSHLAEVEKAATTAGPSQIQSPSLDQPETPIKNCSTISAATPASSSLLVASNASCRNSAENPLSGV